MDSAFFLKKGGGYLQEPTKQAKVKATMVEKWELWSAYKVSPCPFCGKDMGVVERDVWSTKDRPEYIVKCRECFAITPRAKTIDDAISLWESRVFPDYVLMTNNDAPYTPYSECWADLKNAIVTSIFDEYKENRKNVIRNWRNPRRYSEYLDEAEQTKRFFNSDFYALLTDISGEKVIAAADAQARYDVLFRDKKKCRGCGNDSCEHQHYIWWLWDKNNRYDKCLGWKRRYGKKRTESWTKPLY